MSDILLIKDKAKKMWSTFAAFETVTALAAPELIKFSGVQDGERLLDVGCGTGVVALTAAQVGAKVSGSDLTPELIIRAKENAQISNLNIDFQVADVEDLPYKDNEFDFVLSQFGHMFAPRPEVAIKEMLRVLRPGGIIAFSTWPPELLTGRLFILTGKYGPPPPKDISPPVMWGEVEIIKKRFGKNVRNITFHRAEYGNPALSPAHMRVALEAYIGPIGATIKLLESNPEKLTEFRKAMEDLLSEYFQNNTVVQSYLMTRAIKN